MLHYSNHIKNHDPLPTTFSTATSLSLSLSSMHLTRRVLLTKFLSRLLTEAKKFNDPSETKLGRDGLQILPNWRPWFSGYSQRTWVVWKMECPKQGSQTVSGPHHWLDEGELRQACCGGNIGEHVCYVVTRLGQMISQRTSVLWTMKTPNRFSPRPKTLCSAAGVQKF